MTVTVRQTYYAVGAGIRSSFQGYGGTEPYLYEVNAGGAGGTINPSTGVYTAPAVIPSTAQTAYDTITVTDYVGATGTARILVGLPIVLFCDILQREMNLANGRVYLWDQKLTQPQDNELYIAVSVPSTRPFGNVNRAASTGGGMDQEQYVAMQALVEMDVISRGPAARDRKEEVLLALKSAYSQNQQTANSFYIASLPGQGRFLNLSSVDGAAIPYRYKIGVQMQYAYAKTKAVDYYDDFSEAEVTTDP